MKVSIIVPSLGRPQQLLNLISNLGAVTNKEDYELIVVLEQEDFQSWQAMAGLPGVKLLAIPTPSTPIFAWNFGLRHSFAEWIFQGADDIVFPKDWLETALSVPNKGFIAFPDGQKNLHPYWEPHYMVTKTWLKTYQNGVFLVPHYRHWGCDVEICERAGLSNTFQRSSVIIAHNHWTKDASRIDDTYIKAQKWYRRDMNLVDLRRSLGYPNDFEAII